MGPSMSIFPWVDFTLSMALGPRCSEPIKFLSKCVGLSPVCLKLLQVGLTAWLLTCCHANVHLPHLWACVHVCTNFAVAYSITQPQETRDAWAAACSEHPCFHRWRLLWLLHPCNCNDVRSVPGVCHSFDNNSCVLLLSVRDCVT